MATLSKAQISKARDEIADKMLTARRDFVLGNADYKDIVLDTDDIRVLKAFTDGKTGDDLTKDKDIAKLRIDYVKDGRSTATMDLLTVKTEKDIPEADKYQGAAWLGVKRYKADGSIWKRGYGDPELAWDTPTSNRFIGADGSDFQVLRAKGLLQLMTEDEIADFCDNVDVNFDMYFRLFF